MSVLNINTKQSLNLYIQNIDNSYYNNLLTTSSATLTYSDSSNNIKSSVYDNNAIYFVNQQNNLSVNTIINYEKIESNQPYSINSPNIYIVGDTNIIGSLKMAGNAGYNGQVLASNGTTANWIDLPETSNGGWSGLAQSDLNMNGRNISNVIKIDASGTSLTIGNASSTGILIGKSGITASFPGDSSMNNISVNNLSVRAKATFSNDVSFNGYSQLNNVSSNNVSIYNASIKGNATFDNAVLVTGQTTFSTPPHVPDPRFGNDAASKGYVDSLVGQYSGGFNLFFNYSVTDSSYSSYKSLSQTLVDISSQQQVDTILSTAGNTLIAQFVTLPFGINEISTGIWDTLIYGAVDNTSDTIYYFFKLSKMSAAGTVSTLLTSQYSSDINATPNNMPTGYNIKLAITSSQALVLTDRLVIEIWANRVGSGSNITLRTFFQNSYYSFTQTTLNAGTTLLSSNNTWSGINNFALDINTSGSIIFGNNLSINASLIRNCSSIDNTGTLFIGNVSATDVNIGRAGRNINIIGTLIAYASTMNDIGTYGQSNAMNLWFGSTDGTATILGRGIRTGILNIQAASTLANTINMGSATTTTTLGGVVNASTIKNCSFIDNSGTIVIGNTSATGITIGRSGQVTDICGNLRIAGLAGTNGQVLTSNGTTASWTSIVSGWVGTAATDLDMTNKSIINASSVDTNNLSLKLGNTSASGVIIGRSGQVTNIQGNLQVAGTAGTNGQVLTSNGTTASWTTISSGWVGTATSNLSMTNNIIRIINTSTISENNNPTNPQVDGILIESTADSTARNVLQNTGFSVYASGYLNAVLYKNRLSLLDTATVTLTDYYGIYLQCRTFSTSYVDYPYYLGVNGILLKNFTHLAKYDHTGITFGNFQSGTINGINYSSYNTKINTSQLISTQPYTIENSSTLTINSSVLNIGGLGSSNKINLNRPLTIGYTGTPSPGDIGCREFLMTGGVTTSATIGTVTTAFDLGIQPVGVYLYEIRYNYSTISVITTSISTAPTTISDAFIMTIPNTIAGMNYYKNIQVYGIGTAVQLYITISSNVASTVITSMSIIRTRFG